MVESSNGRNPVLVHITGEGRMGVLMEFVQNKSPLRLEDVEVYFRDLPDESTFTILSTEVVFNVLSNEVDFHTARSYGFVLQELG